tara:strand:+ start:1387 stop:1884 length:498 start_codon:yes stop_codon:yes gene_type:complete
MEMQTQNNGRVVDINKPTVNMVMQSDTLFKNNSQVSLKGIVEQSKTSEIFFSEDNIDIIQQTIRYQIFKRNNKIISKQSNTEIIIIMRSIFLQYGDSGQINDDIILENIKKTNTRVITYCVNNISNQLEQHNLYIDNINNLPVPLENPAYENKQNYTYDTTNIIV